MQTQLIDIGANLSHKSFTKDLKSVLDYAETEAGLTACVVTTTHVRDWQKNLALCRRYSSATFTLVCTVGIHPHDASSFVPETLSAMRQAVKEERVVAIGETGLDYNRLYSSRQQQLESFRAHVGLACELGTPLFLHEREAHSDLLTVLDAYCNLPPTVIHCFTGTKEEALEYLRRGFFLGITGYVAMRKRGDTLRTMLQQGIIPLNRIMVETDCPFSKNTEHSVLCKLLFL
jgi:TatD DNase family protein